MRFKDFITRQRMTVFVAGLIVCGCSLAIAHAYGAEALPGELFIDLSVSSITVIFTTLIIDYLGVLEESSKTQSVAGLAEDEIKATCFRVTWRMARLFGLDRPDADRGNISNREEAKTYLDIVTDHVDKYLQEHSIMSDDTPVDEALFAKYVDRLQQAQTELEQTLILYEYALPYSLRERILNLRRELQVADHLFGFIDSSFNEANISLVRIMSQSIYELIQDVLEHDSRVLAGPIHEKDSELR